MSELARISMSLDADILKQFDKQVEAAGCPTRSKAIEDLIRESLMREKWSASDSVVAGAIILV